MAHRIGILLGLWFVSAVSALAQVQTTGAISGTVLSKDGGVVRDAKVTIESPALQGARGTVTSSQGKFLASLLPPGSYLVTVTAPDFAPQSVTLRVGIGETYPVIVTLTPGEGLKEEVTVYGDLTKLETTAGGESFNYDDIDNLPIRDRSIERVAELAPNISSGPTPDTLSISGAPSFDTVVLLDGAEVSDPYFGSAPELFLEDAVEEVQVMTNGIDARYGRFQGGVINATTKSGGNTFDGTVRATFAKEKWNEKTPFGESQSDVLTKTFQATLGGYIVKDRVWFFLGGRTIPTEEVTNQTIETGESFATQSDEDRYQIKLRAALSPDHIIEAGFLNFDATSENRAGLPAGDLRAATGVREDPRKTYTLTYQGVLSPSLFVDVQATKKDVSIESGASDLALGSPFLEGLATNPFFQVLHNHWWDATDTDQRDNETLSAGLTQVLTTGNWGTHTLEYGVQYVNSNIGGENRQSATGFNLLNYDYANFSDFTSVPGEGRFNLISYANGGITYRWEALPLGGDQELKNTAVYVQDSWERGKWRLDAGLRWEKYEGSGPEPTLDLDFDALSPRLGVTYNVTPDWQLQGTWGRYVSRFNDNIAGSVSGVGSAPAIVSLYTGPDVSDQTYDQIEAIIQDDSNWGLITSVTDPKQPTRFLAEDVEAPYANDFNLSIKRALPRNTGTVVVSYIRRDYQDLLDDFVGGYGISTVTDPLGGPDLQLDTTIWDNASEAERRYNAVAATFDYRPSARWNVGGNYTYSTTEGNYEGEGRNTPASGSIIGNYVNSVQQNAAVPDGYLLGDVRHRVRAWSSYRFDLGRAGAVTAGSAFNYRSGTNWNRTGSVLLGDDPTYLNDQGFYTYYADGRGNNRFSGFWALDLSGRYQITLVKDLDLWVKLDVANVTNEDQLILFRTGGSVAPDPDTDVLVWTPAGNFGTASAANNYQTPRTYLLSAGLRF